MKRILFLLHVPPPVHGSSIVGEYIKNSEIINQVFDCRYINIGTSLKVDEIGKNSIKKILRYFSILRIVLDQLFRFSPHLCYLDIAAKGPAFYKDSVIVFFVKLFGVKLVYHFHNKGIAKVHHRPLNNFLYKWLFKNSEVILLSKYLYSDIQKYVPETRVHYCPNGIPDSFQGHHELVDSYNNSSKVTEILFLSNLIKSKGVFVLLDACRILHEKQISFHCSFVGGEGDIIATELQERIKRMNLESHVQYAGVKYGEEKVAVFSKADIFAFPTYYNNECFPLVLLEAMQHYLPVVSTFEGGIQDIIENNETGYLIIQKDVQALAEKLELLIRNPRLRTVMGSAGRTKYEREFTLQAFELRLKSILIDILNNGKR